MRVAKRRVLERPQLRAARYAGLSPASTRASRTLARVKASATMCEQLLSTVFEHRRISFERNAEWLPGKPDLVFRRARVAVFCDGDFWHGREWSQRKQKLARGHNAEYWIAKISANMRRDRRHQRKLKAAGWTVLRFWESDIMNAPHSVGAKILRAVHGPTVESTLSQPSASGRHRLHRASSGIGRHRVNESGGVGR